jgi:hypothetical protein
MIMMRNDDDHAVDNDGLLMMMDCDGDYVI